MIFNKGAHEIITLDKIHGCTKDVYASIYTDEYFGVRLVVAQRGRMVVKPCFVPLQYRVVSDQGN